MRREIVQFVREMCAKYRFEAIYQPENDTYCIMYKGRAIQNFNSEQFYNYPLRQRRRELGIFLHLALAHNLGEKYKDQFFLPRKHGIKIA